MLKRLITVLMALLLQLPLQLLLLAPAVAANAACRTASVGLSDLGYSSYLDGRVFRGTSVDVMEEIHRRTGCTFTLALYPHGRLYAQFFSSQLDISGASVRSAERDRHGVWLPYTYTRFELLLTNGSAGHFHSLDDFIEHSTARLNVTRGVSYSAATMAQMERLRKLGRLEYVNDYNVVFRKIMAGRADGTLASALIRARYLHAFQLDGKMSSMPIDESPRSVVGMYVSKSTVEPAVLRSYAAALRAMVLDGTVQKIYVRYLGEEEARRQFAGGTREILDAMPL